MVFPENENAVLEEQSLRLVKVKVMRPLFLFQPFAQMRQAFVVCGGRTVNQQRPPAVGDRRWASSRRVCDSRAARSACGGSFFFARGVVRGRKSSACARPCPFLLVFVLLFLAPPLPCPCPLRPPPALLLLLLLIQLIAKLCKCCARPFYVRMEGGGSYEAVGSAAP